MPHIVNDVVSRFPAAMAVLALVVLTACTDAATRVAYDIESGVNSLGAQEGARRDIDSGGIGVSCYNASGGQVGYGTTYHLRFVDVPATVTVNKGFNETALIEVQRIDGRAVVVGLR
jgi:hypothetical protein